MRGSILPEDYRWLRERPADGEAVEARSADAVQAAAHAVAGDIFFTAPQKSGEDMRRVIGKCRIIADSLEELRQVSCAVQDAAGGWEPVGIRLTLEGWEGLGFPADTLPALSQEVRKLPALSIQGCFVQGDTTGLYGAALGRYYRNCFETAKRMSAILPCRVGFLCIAGGGDAARRGALEHPESVPAFRRTVEAIAAQNRSAFYAKLFVT